MAILKVVKELGSGREVVLGYVCQYPNGKYWFNPRLSNRRSSRKQHDTPDAAIPAWARKEGDKLVVQVPGIKWGRVPNMEIECDWWAA